MYAIALLPGHVNSPDYTGWRFTDLSSLRQVAFQASAQQVELASSSVSALTLPEAANSRLVFVNGVYAPQLSTVANLPDGVV